MHLPAVRCKKEFLKAKAELPHHIDHVTPFCNLSKVNVYPLVFCSQGFAESKRV